MATRDDFSPFEWAAVVKAAMAPASMMVVLVDFNLFALGKKLQALWAALDTANTRSSSFLMRDIFKQVSDQRKGNVKGVNENDAKEWLNEQDNSGNLRAALPAMLREALDILAFKASQQEIEEYCAFVMHSMEAVAHASHSKGMFATKGDLVSEDENSFMNEVRLALGR